jgi:hypothetical protein
MTLSASLPLRAIASKPMSQWFLAEDQPFARNRGRCRRRRRRRRRPLLAAQPRQHRETHCTIRFGSSRNRFAYRSGDRHHLARALVLKTQHAPASASGDRDCVAVAVADNAHAHGRGFPTRLPNRRNAHGFDATALSLPHPTETVTELQLRGWP